MAELFAFDRKIQSDQVSEPNVTTTELKNAIAVVYNHMKKHRKADRDELLSALDVMAEACNNENWVIYVP